jgi:hypothetical protein
VARDQDLDDIVNRQLLQKHVFCENLVVRSVVLGELVQDLEDAWFTLHLYVQVLVADVVLFQVVLEEGHSFNEDTSLATDGLEQLLVVPIINLNIDV